MDQQLLCAWLQLPSGAWPPDHYTLLGLNARDSDVARIEQQVYQRMEIVRRYQLTHPEPATEAMNRLAQALVCLTDPVAKKAYDAALFPEPRQGNGQAASAEQAGRPSDSLAKLAGLKLPEAVGGDVQKLVSRVEADWQTSPPPAYSEWQSSVPPVRLPAVDAFSKAHQELIEIVQQSSPQQEVEEAPVIAAAERAAEATSVAPVPPAPTMAAGRLRDKRALYVYITRVRRLLWAWQQAGLFLKHDPPRVVNRPIDAMDLMAHMQAIRALLGSSPTVLGTAGQPGYHVLTLARQDDIVPRLKKLSVAQRESLARDWQAGHELLLENRHALRHQLRALRARGLFGHIVHVLGAALRENIGLILVLLALIALNLALQDKYPEIRHWRFEQTMLFVALVCARLILWWHSYAPLKARLHRPRPIERKRYQAAARIGRQPETTATKV